MKPRRNELHREKKSGMMGEKKLKDHGQIKRATETARSVSRRHLKRSKKKVMRFGEESTFKK